MLDNPPIPEPTSIDEVEGLILKLYDPIPPAAVSSIQDILQRLQRSPQAWILARELLSRQNEKVRFFGALTLIVKLNTDSTSLDHEEADELFTSILGWLVESTIEGSSSLVTRKLSSALVVFCLHFPTHGSPCLRRLLCSLYLRRHANADEIAGFWDAHPVFEPRLLETAVVFATDLVEESGKVDVNSESHLGIYQYIRDSVHDVAQLISTGLNPQSGSTPPELSLKQRSVKCLLAWIAFSHRLFSRGDPLLAPFQSLLPTVLEVVSYSSDVFTSAMELFTELLSSHQGFLTNQYVSMLLEFCGTPLVSEYYTRLVQGDDSVECVQLGLSLLALGDSRMDSFLSETRDSRSHHLLEQLCGLLTVKGYPVVEDRVFVPAVEFWSTVVETVAEDVFSDDERGGSQSAHDLKQYATRAVHSAYLKITLPPTDVFTEWDSADREGFMDARKDVADLLQAMHAISGRDLVSSFTDLVLQAVPGARWAELEAAAFCLGALAECVSRSPTCDDLLTAVFSPEFFSMVQPCESSIPMRTRQSCISLIEKYADYFERNTSSLPNALNLLFSVMDDSPLGGAASKSIYRLCRSCRPALVSEASTFVAEYRTIATQRQVDCLANERIVGAIGAIIQAIDESGAQATVLHQLLDVLFGDAQASFLATSTSQAGAVSGDSRLYRCGRKCLSDVPQGEIPLHTGIRVLRCLVAIGKGLQAPADIPVDLESHGHARAGNADPEHLESVHLRIVTVMSEMRAVFPSSGEAVEAICGIFRAGFTETTPGPFVFQPRVVSDYLTQQGLSTPRIGALVSAACSFVSSRSPETPGWQAIMTSLMNWVVGLIRELPAVDADPELSQNGIEFVCRLFTKDPGVPLHPQQRESLISFFTFTLHVLDGQEPLPKATASEFWAIFASHKSQHPEYQELINQAMADMGPPVALSIIRNIGGNASRSELDKLVEPLKKLASLHPSAQSWMQAALFHPSFPSQNVSENDKLTFLRKVISLRGGRMTNQVAREFWVSSRGSKFSYAT